MRWKHKGGRFTLVAMLGTAVAMLSFAPFASAHEGDFARFDNCPSTNPEVFKCVRSVTEGGEVVLGKKTVPIVNPVTLQGGFGVANAERVSKFFAATNGETLSRTPQPVPGGLAGLVNCKEITSFLVRIGCEAVFENGLTGVDATLELARPASEIQISERRLLNRTGPALVLPVKVHLENPLLGSSCYVGSSGSPLTWNLTAGTTSPPPPNEPISGQTGTITFLGEGRILHLSNNKLVDNAWSAPHASGCGGPIVELIIDPIIDASVGLPAAAGTNTAILENTIDIATAEAVNNH